LCCCGLVATYNITIGFYQTLPIIVHWLWVFQKLSRNITMFISTHTLFFFFLLDNKFKLVLPKYKRNPFLLLLMSSLTCSQIGLSPLCGWNCQTHPPHKIDKSITPIPNNRCLNWPTRFPWKQIVWFWTKIWTFYLLDTFEKKSLQMFIIAKAIEHQVQ
jgi:hypothetical protein